MKNPTSFGGRGFWWVILNQLRKIATAPRPTASDTAEILALTSWKFIKLISLRFELKKASLCSEKLSNDIVKVF
jgi:hypothetical protein